MARLVAAGVEAGIRDRGPRESQRILRIERVEHHQRDRKLHVGASAASTVSRSASVHGLLVSGRDLGRRAGLTREAGLSFV